MIFSFFPLYLVLCRNRQDRQPARQTDSGSGSGSLVGPAAASLGEKEVIKGGLLRRKVVILLFFFFFCIHNRERERERGDGRRVGPWPCIWHTTKSQMAAFTFLLIPGQHSTHAHTGLEQRKCCEHFFSVHRNTRYSFSTAVMSPILRARVSTQEACDTYFTFEGVNCTESHQQTEW